MIKPEDGGSGTNQPQWELVGNLGDIGYPDYGGFFVYEDLTGVYPPEAEYLEVRNPDETDDDQLIYFVYRFILEPCHPTSNGGLGDNEYHLDYEVWFSEYLDQLASFVGMEVEELKKLFCSQDPLDLGRAYQVVLDFWGPEELDSYPLGPLTRKEVSARYGT